MDAHSPENEQLLLQILQIDVRVAEFRAEEYRRLCLSLIGQGRVAGATTQIHCQADVPVRSLTMTKSREELRPFTGSTLILSCRGRGQKLRQASRQVLAVLSPSLGGPGFSLIFDTAPNTASTTALCTALSIGPSPIRTIRTFY